jgi:formylglycine-generating enzyme required for sulfatase activity
VAKETFARWRSIPHYSDSFAVTAPVDQLWSNEWGLSGVGGNVWELCLSSEKGDALGVWRGGSWSHYKRNTLKCAYRGEHDVMSRDPYSGFRLVLAPVGF